jgi:hypothetical protein
MSGQEKAAGVLDTPEAASQNEQFEFTLNAKRFATLRARAALAGIVLVESTTDHGDTVYIASRWALTKHLASLDDAEHWLNTVMGAQA